VLASPRLPLLGLTLALAALCAATRAAADGGGREVRVRGACTGRNVSELRVRAEDGRLRIDVRVQSARRYPRWTVVVLRERRIVFRGPVRTVGGGRELELRRMIADWPGTDTLVVRASTRGGQSCRASATV
jgi:hypothetical protein